jgi:uroporphyrinogen III methyltransferase / synthase
LRPPVLVIVGPVAALGADTQWFGRQPLHGVGILLTRPAGQNEAAAAALTGLGADVYIEPALRIEPPSDQYAALDAAVDALSRGGYRGVALTSANAVDALLERLAASGRDLRALAGTLLAAVGPKTAERLHGYRLRADLVPEQFSAAGLLEHFQQQPAEWFAGQSWLLPQADRAAPTLAVGLERLGARVHRVPAYCSQPLSRLSPAIAAALERGRIQWVWVTSSASAHALAQVCQPYREQLRALSFSSAISDLLRSEGWPPALELTQPTVEAALAAQLSAHEHAA